MGDPCHDGCETCCVLQAKEQRQSVMSDGTKLGPQHVNAADVMVQHREVALKTYKRKYPGSHGSVPKATDGRTGSTAELDHQRLPPGTGLENGIVMRQPGDLKSTATNVGNLAALSQAEESILITPRDLADVQMQRREVLLKTYQKRYFGSYKHVHEAVAGKSGSSVELGRQSQRLTGTGSEDGIIMRQPDDEKSTTTNVRNLAPLSIAEESVLITPTAGKSCDAQARPVKNDSNVAGASGEGGSHMTPATRHCTQAVRNGWSWTRPPTGFKQVLRPKEKTELSKEPLQLLSMALKAKEKRQNTTLSSNFSSMKHINGRSSEQNDRFNIVLLNDSDGTNQVQPVGHACCLCGNDLAYSPTSRLSGTPFKSGNLPDVAVLLCGHGFHQRCMQHNMSEEQLKDPQCFLCDKHSENVS